MMGMTGILLLIAELIFDASTYYLQICLYWLLILIPVLVSPWETLNGQLVGRKQSIKNPN